MPKERDHYEHLTESQRYERVADLLACGLVRHLKQALRFLSKRSSMCPLSATVNHPKSEGRSGATGGGQHDKGLEARGSRSGLFLCVQFGEVC